MISPIVLMCCGLLAAAPEQSGSTRVDNLRAYETAKAQTGRNAEAHVKLALWCEARGLKAQRQRELQAALTIDPDNFAARGLLGQVAFQGRWEDPEDVAAKLKADEALSAKLAAYNTRRDALLQVSGKPGKNSRAALAKAHVAVGMWCEQNALQAEAMAHFTSAVVLDPYRDASWKHLGYVKHNGHWMSRGQMGDERREADAQRRANLFWEPKLRKWRTDLGESRLQREQAEERLAEVYDPRAIASIIRVFRDGTEKGQSLAIQLLGQIDTPESTWQLASLAVASEFSPVREAAIQVLKKRESRDYAGQLVEMIHTPVRYRVQPVSGPGSPGALLVETPRFRMLRTYDAPPPFMLNSSFYGYVGYDANGLPVVARGIELLGMAKKSLDGQARTVAMFEARAQGLIAEANLKAASSQQQLIADVNSIETNNAQAEVINSRVADVLQGALDAPQAPPVVKPAASDLLTETDIPGEDAKLAPKNDEDSWRAWWYDRLGYRYDPPATITLTIAVSPQTPPPAVYSCFIAGTPVRTREGLRPIETLRVGDQVLSQDIATGALTFQPIMVVHHNKPGRTLRLTLDDGEVLSASVYHRFWRPGHGWAMARELKSGDVLRTLEGVARIESVEEGVIEPLFNLDVAQSRTFFVGRGDTLVHDNTLPALRVKPFDIPPALAALGAPAQ